MYALRTPCALLVLLNSSVFWDITRHKMVLNGTLKMGPIYSPETSVSNHLRHVITQKDEFGSTAAEAFDLACSVALIFVPTPSLNLGRVCLTVLKF